MLLWIERNDDDDVEMKKHKRGERGKKNWVKFSSQQRFCNVVLNISFSLSRVSCNALWCKTAYDYYYGIKYAKRDNKEERATSYERRRRRGIIFAACQTSSWEDCEWKGVRKRKKRRETRKRMFDDDVEREKRWGKQVVAHAAKNELKLTIASRERSVNWKALGGNW